MAPYRRVVMMLMRPASIINGARAVRQTVRRRAVIDPAISTLMPEASAGKSRRDYFAADKLGGY